MRRKGESHDSKQLGESREKVKKSCFGQHPKEKKKQNTEKLRSSDLELRKASELHRLLDCSATGDHRVELQGRKNTLSQ